MKWLWSGMFLVGALGTALAAGCDSTSTTVGDCKTEVDSGNSPAAGVLTLSGLFYPDESVTLIYTVNGQTLTAQGTPPDARSTLTLTGLPSGQRNYSITVSCEGGQDDLGSKSFLVL